MRHIAAADNMVTKSIRISKLRLLGKVVVIAVAVVFTRVCLTLVLDFSSGGYLPAFSITTSPANDTSDEDRGNPEQFIPDNPSKSPVGQPAVVPDKYHIEEEDFCRRQGDLQVVAFVHSAISRVENRRHTRATWANSTIHGFQLGVVFMVGRAKTKQEEDIVREESSLYHDIVQGDYADDYRLLSYKALAAINWVLGHCSHVPWTLHADDDLILDVFLLQEFIQNLNSSQEQFQCRAIMKSPVRRKGRYKVARNEYPGRVYPPYCQGPVWLLSTQHLHKLLQASKTVNYLWVDDAYLTGLLRAKANISIANIKAKVGTGKFDMKDIGTKLAWFHLKKVKMADIWPAVVRHHQKTKTKVTEIVSKNVSTVTAVPTA
nr:beta-1,3-galactosyltransferase 5-like [Procambarus clarkii]XP_045585456.1 beta-1,3-galactosyltransferase 5-like [Procambarus clarkii]